MRKIIVATFMTMDGVMQAPGGKEEDTMGDFKWGGWQFAFQDEAAGQSIMQVMDQPFDLLLGRRTYEIFSGYWPYKDDVIGNKFNTCTKYMVGTSATDTSWEPTVVIKTNVVNELKKLKQQEGPALLVWGSSVLMQTLFTNGLVDELHTWTYPITLGQGKKLFATGTQPLEWKVTNASVTPTGIVMATYTPLGNIRPGGQEDEFVSEKEKERRKRWKEEG